MVVFLAGVALVLYNRWSEAAGPNVHIAGGGLVRAGILTLALWLALPERADQIRWSRVAAIVTAGLLLAIRPKVLLFLVPFLVVVGIAVYVLRPRPKPGERARSRARR